jgi:hypothetical protein
MNRKRIIINSIIICIVLFIAYSLSIQYVISKWPVRGENQWSENIIAAEEIIYISNTPHTVIVGTSMAARLESEMFSGDVFNLSFRGKSVFNGLSVLEKLKLAPRVVLVEINALTSLRDDSFIDPLFQQPFYTFKKYLPALRERNRPLTDFKRGILETRRLLFKSNKEKNNTVTQKKSSVRSDKVVVSSNKNPLFDQMIERALISYESIPDEHTTEDIMKELKLIVDGLISRGSKVVLFEMPMHPLVCDSPEIIHMRAAIHETFTNDQYLILQPPNCSDFNTTDGIHLPFPDAKRYADDLQRQCSVHNVTIGRN